MTSVLTLPMSDFRRALVTLMQRAKLPWNTRLGAEDRLSIEVANQLRALTLEGQLQACWTHVANEGKRTAIVGLILRAMGLLPGAADFVFTWQGGACWIELKAGKGKQSVYQGHFQTWCEGMRVPYFLCRSLDEVMQALRDVGAFEAKKNLLGA